MRLLIMIVLALSLPLTGCLMFGEGEHPTDSELLENFATYESDLDTLRQMCEDDSNMSRIAPDFLWRRDNFAWPKPEAEWGITKERWEEYKRLFAKIGLRNGIINRSPESILFIANSRGLVTSGTSKGFAYLSKPADSRDSLDHFDWRTAKPDEDIFFRHIKGNWYLYFGG